MRSFIDYIVLLKILICFCFLVEPNLLLGIALKYLFVIFLQMISHFISGIKYLVMSWQVIKHLWMTETLLPDSISYPVWTKIDNKVSLLPISQEFIVLARSGHKS